MTGGLETASCVPSIFRQCSSKIVKFYCLFSCWFCCLLSLLTTKINLTQSSMTSDFQMYGIQQAYPALRIVWHSPWRGNESRAAEDQHCGPVMAATAGESLGGLPTTIGVWPFFEFWTSRLWDNLILTPHWMYSKLMLNMSKTLRSQACLLMILWMGIG